mgnify:CR=1 FL=1
MLHDAHRRGWLPAVPPIAKAAEPAKRVAWLTREQADALLEQLPPHLAAISAPLAAVADEMVRALPDGPELSAGLRKLLEAKDAAVRAVVAK